MHEHTLLRRGSCYEHKQSQQTQMDKKTTLWRQVIWPCEIRRIGGFYSGSIIREYYLNQSAFPCKFSLLVLHFICISLLPVRTSEPRSEYFSALTTQSVNVYYLCLNASVSFVYHSHRISSRILRCPIFLKIKTLVHGLHFLFPKGVKDA